jgi:hypothetical protein
MSIVHAGTSVLPEGKDGKLDELMRQWRENKPTTRATKWNNDGYDRPNWRRSSSLARCSVFFCPAGSVLPARLR